MADAVGVLLGERHDNWCLRHHGPGEIVMWATIAQWVAAAGTFSTVLVLLWQGRVRRQEAHLAQVINIVLEPLRTTLEGRAAVVLRTTCPLQWSGKGIEVNPRPGWFFLPSSPGDLMASQAPSSDSNLYDVAYGAVKKQRRYRRLIADFEQFDKTYTKFVSCDLVAFTQSIEKLLRAGCMLPDMETNTSAPRCCAYSQLSIYAFSKLWINHYSYQLCVEDDTQKPGYAKLWTPGGSYYSQGATRDEAIAIMSQVESLVSDSAIQARVDELKASADGINRAREMLLKTIAQIRWDGAIT
ncbi:MAG: hypothetical protein ACYCXX_15535 [Acidiferrobacter thiooxydans]